MSPSKQSPLFKEGNVVEYLDTALGKTDILVIYGVGNSGRAYETSIGSRSVAKVDATGIFLKNSIVSGGRSRRKKNSSGKKRRKSKSIRRR